MEKRFRINQIQPDAYRALLAIENYLNRSSLDKGHYVLIKLRASQLNGCRSVFTAISRSFYNTVP